MRKIIIDTDTGCGGHGRCALVGYSSGFSVGLLLLLHKGGTGLRTGNHF